MEPDNKKENGENYIWRWIIRETFLITTILSGFLFLYIPINNLEKQNAVMSEQLKTLTEAIKEHQALSIENAKEIQNKFDNIDSRFSSIEKNVQGIMVFYNLK